MLAPTRPFIREILTLFRGFTFWRKSPAASLDHQAFSYVEENGDVMLLKALMIYFTLELTAGHLLLVFLAPAAAWPIFWLGLLNLAYLIGVIKIWRDNPILLSDKKLKIRLGLKHHMDINLSEIASIKTTNLTRLEMKQTGYKILSFMAEPNIVIHMKKALDRRDLLGRKKAIKTIALVLDKPSSFIQATKVITSKSTTNP